MATSTMTIDADVCLPRPASPATKVPSTMATNVPISTIALPPTSSESRSTSGSNPYLAGAKNVECMPIRNSAPSNTSMLLGGEAEAGDRHDRDLGGLDGLQHQRLVVTIGELAGHAGEQHERQDEQPRGDVGQQRGRQCRVARGLVGREDDQHVLVDIVVERAQRLRAEERQEASLDQQFEL